MNVQAHSIEQPGRIGVRFNEAEDFQLIFLEISVRLFDLPFKTLYIQKRKE
jgi:hypothetical protein